MKGKVRSFGKGNKAGMPGMMKESDPREIAQDKKLAAKNKMSMGEWEQSPQDRLHDSGAKKTRGFATGGELANLAAIGQQMAAPQPRLNPNPLARIPPPKSPAPTTVATPPKPTQSAPPQANQNTPVMKQGGKVRGMKQGGVTTTEMKAVGRNLARVANQKSKTKGGTGDTMTATKGGGSIVKGSKKGWGIARGR